MVRKTLLAFPAHAQLAILRIWQETYGKTWSPLFPGDLWLERLLASMSYINGYSVSSIFQKLLWCKLVTSLKIVMRNFLFIFFIQSIILFYTTGLGLVIISSIVFRFVRNKAVQRRLNIVFSFGMVFKNLILDCSITVELLLQNRLMSVWCQIFWWTIQYTVCHMKSHGTQIRIGNFKLKWGKSGCYI